MKKAIIPAIAVLLISLLALGLLIVPVKPVKAEARSDLDVIFYSSPDTAWTALISGQADIMEWSLTKEQKEAAEADPNLVLDRFDENGLYEYDVNNNYTIATYPGIRSATNELKVRQAIACLVDKDYIVANILNYFGARVDLPICKPQDSWMNESVIGDNYLYPYNPEQAAQLLTEAGFADTDGNGWLNYPATWPGAPGADTTAYPLVVCVRSDDSRRLAAGQYIISQLETTLKATSIGAGFKTTGTDWQQPRSVLSPKVMGAQDYQVYTGGWSFGRFPTYLFFLFHSMFWYSYGSNYVTGMNSSNEPNYPLLDQYAAAIWYTPDIPSAIVAAKKFGGLFAQLCCNIPLWSYSSYWCHRKTLAGVVNENGYGTENAYTFLNAYRVEGGPIRFAITNGPSRLNILYSQWYFEYGFLDRWITSAMSVQPYDLAVDQPWVVQDWEASTYDDAGTTKTVVTYYIRKDVGIVAPVTGNFIRNFNAEDFEFTIWYNYDFDDSWQWGSFMDVRYTKVVDVNGDGWKELQVYFDDQSYWFYSAPTYPLMTKDELLDPLCAQKSESWAQTGTAEYSLESNVVSVVSAKLGTTDLVEGQDYIIRGGYDVYEHEVFVPLRDLTGTISITYWYADIPAIGFYLAGLPWTTTMYSLGTHYPVSMTTDPPGIGDTIVLKKNPYFFMETPLLGEVNWAWNWVGTTKPRSGNYKIDIYDVVRATGAYCSRGDGAFNPSYFSGADLDASDLGHIGIYDLVTITGKYGQTFGTPP
jgi:ABC-type transport system substrate-binding protein